MGLQYLPSQGHYILINLERLDGTVAVLLLYLLHKVFVRWGSEWGLNNWIRVTRELNGKTNGSSEVCVQYWPQASTVFRCDSISPPQRAERQPA